MKTDENEYGNSNNNDLIPTKEIIPTPQKKKLTKKQKKNGACVLAILVLISLTVGTIVSLNNNKNKSTNPAEATVSNSENSGTKYSEDTSDEASASNIKVDSGIERTDKAMEKYEVLSSDAFDALQLDERLIYSQYLIDSTVSEGDYDIDYTNNVNGKAYIIKPTATSKNNSGQEILDINLYAMQISCLQITGSENRVKPYDVLDGEKSLSSVFYEVGKGKSVSEFYAAFNAFEKKLTTGVVISYIHTNINTSELTDGKDNNGKPIQYKIVTYKDQDNSVYYARFIYHEFTSYNRETKATWLLENQSAKLENINSGYRVIK